MTDSKGKVKNAKDKVVGEVKEVIKLLAMEILEFKGKIQSSKSDLKEKTEEIKKASDR